MNSTASRQDDWMCRTNKAWQSRKISKNFTRINHSKSLIQKLNQWKYVADNAKMQKSWIKQTAMHLSRLLNREIEIVTHNSIQKAYKYLNEKCNLLRTETSAPTRWNKSEFSEEVSSISVEETISLSLEGASPELDWHVRFSFLYLVLRFSQHLRSWRTSRWMGVYKEVLKKVTLKIAR